MKETNPFMTIRSSGMSAARDWSLPPAVRCHPQCGAIRCAVPPAVRDEGMLYIGNCKA